MKELLSKSVDVVRRRMFEAANPERQAAINQAMAEITGPQSGSAQRDFAPAQRAMLALASGRGTDRKSVARFCQAYKYEEAVAAFSAISGVRLATVDHLITRRSRGSDPDRRQVVRDRMDDRPRLDHAAAGAGTLPPPDIEEARVNYERLSPATAERVLAFWRAREIAKPGLSYFFLPPKRQVSGAASFAFRLSSIARHRVARPRHSPVVRTLRGPDKIF